MSLRKGEYRGAFLKVPEVSQFLMSFKLEVRQPRMDDHQPLFCREEQSAGLESMNGVCTVGVDMTVVKPRDRAAHLTCLIK